MTQDERGDSSVALAFAPACGEPRGPVLRLEASEALQHAGFQLVNARIEWPDGVPTEGWGRDVDARLAQLKAVAEAVERSAYVRLPSTAFQAEARELRDWLAPAEFVLYAPSQYAQAGFPFRPFHADERRWWVMGTAVSDGRQAAVVADCVYNPRAFDADYRGRLLTHATTSGCASGRSIGDALLRATLELVERDAFMRHWFAQAPGLALLPHTLPGWAAARIERLRQGGCRAGVQCLTAGVQPTWLAWAQSEHAHFTCVGAACGLEAEAALGCALQEMETTALARIEGVPATPITPAQVRSPADHGALYATREHFRAADRVLLAPASVRFEEVAGGSSTDADALFHALDRAGHPVYFVDMSIPEAQMILADGPLRTVRALAPGLIPMAFGHGLQPLGMPDAIAGGGRNVHPFS